MLAAYAQARGSAARHDRRAIRSRPRELLEHFEHRRISAEANRTTVLACDRLRCPAPRALVHFLYRSDGNTPVIVVRELEKPVM